jgi:5-methylcytosine-specific restriction endonuclease McrA
MENGQDVPNRIVNLFYSLQGRGTREFTKEDFIKWYNSNLKHGCYYCGITLQMQRDLIDKKLVSSKRFYNHQYTTPKGQIRYGTRGRNFEVDRKNPNAAYSQANCVLACYFCNNDKSDVFLSEQYSRLIGSNSADKKNNSRYRFLSELLNSSKK